MEYLFKLTDKDINEQVYNITGNKVRYAARGIIFNKNGEMAIQYKQKKNEYKLIGGGIEAGEDKVDAFKREVLEETGCTIDNPILFGVTLEERSYRNMKQISYIYICNVINDTGKLSLTKKEIEEESILEWVDIAKALELVTNCYDKLETFQGQNILNSKFATLRDRKILEFYLKTKGMKNNES